MNFVLAADLDVNDFSFESRSLVADHSTLLNPQSFFTNVGGIEKEDEELFALNRNLLFVPSLFNCMLCYVNRCFL